ncbi:ABC transporter permease [Leucobacter soli]|uniref:ABC transporter permease n=1 Tax=Leucobacter soli TaxID=2812850 RepID=UPI00360BA191
MRVRIGTDPHPHATLPRGRRHPAHETTHHGRTRTPHPGHGAPGPQIAAVPRPRPPLPDRLHGDPRRTAARLLLLHARPLRRRAVHLHDGELREAARSALRRRDRPIRGYGAARHPARAAHRLPDRLRDHPDPGALAHHRADRHRPAVLDQLPDPHLRLDPAAQQRGHREPVADGARDHRRAAPAALQLGRRRGGPALHVPAVDDPASLRLAAGDRPSLREAATNLGSTPWRVFRTVTLPMSLPGALTGAIFVFVPSMSNFVIPELLGGGKMVLIGNLIRDQFLEARNWPFGATLALVLSAFLALLIVGQSWVNRRLSGGGDRD